MRAARVDENAAEVVRVLRSIGASVEVLTPRDRGGLPDLLVGLYAKTFLVEVKRPEGPRGGLSGRDLNHRQREWHRLWRGGPVIVARSGEDALSQIMTYVIPVQEGL